MKLTTLTVAFAALTVFAQTAQAHEHHHRGYHHVARYHGHRGSAVEADASYSGFGYSGQQYGATHRTGGAGARPAAWCGWAMRQLVGSDPGTVVQSRAQLGALGPFRPGGVGAVVVWPHHVGKIVGQQNGQWIVEFRQ